MARDACRLEFGTIGGCDGKLNLGVMAFAKGYLAGLSCLAVEGKTPGGLGR